MNVSAASIGRFSATSSRSRGLTLRTTSEDGGNENFRDHLLRVQLHERRAEFTEVDNVNVYAVTWNVAGRAPKTSMTSLVAADLIGEKMEMFKGERADVLVFGFQELDLSKEAFVFAESVREEEWRLSLEQALKKRDRLRNGEADNWMVLKLKRLVGMMLVVFVKKKDKPFIRRCMTAQCGTGIMNKMGNKGAVAIRFQFHESTICILNAHLAAGEADFVERRNADYRSICRRLLFYSQNGYEFGIFDHDALIWIGDLNYRIEGLDRVQVETMLQSGQLRKALKYDQLEIEKRRRAAFDEFKEAPINFLPSYKYDPGTNMFDTSEKLRIPSWCDRILYRGDVSAPIYTSLQSLTLSDHRPVLAFLKVAVRVVDHSRRRVVFNQIMQHLDKLENDYLPMISVSEHDLNFGVLSFLDRSVRKLEISNIGSVPAEVTFIPKHNEVFYCKDWLTIRPAKIALKPGQKTDMELEMTVDKEVVRRLQNGKDDLDDILILHVENGKDFFISVKAEFGRTCFGMPIEKLIANYWDRPVKATDLASPTPTSSIPSLPNPTKFQTLILNQYRNRSVPFELLWLLWDFYRRCLERTEQGGGQISIDVDLFQLSAPDEERVKIRDVLDTRRVDAEEGSAEGVKGNFPKNIRTIFLPFSPEFFIQTSPDTTPFPPIPATIYGVSEMLLLYLESLPQPIVAAPLVTQFFDASTLTDEIYHMILAKLSAFHKATLRSVIALAAELISAAGSDETLASNGNVDKKFIELLFSNALFRSDSWEIEEMSRLNGVRRLVAKQEMEKKKIAFFRFLMTAGESVWK